MAEGAAAPATSFPSPLLANTGTLKNLQCSRVTKSSWGFLCNTDLFSWKHMSPTPVPGIRDQFNLQESGLNLKAGVGKCSSGGVPSQCKVSLRPQKFRSWHLFNHPLIPYSCCESIIVCKSENTQYAYLLKEWNNFSF